MKCSEACLIELWLNEVFSLERLNTASWDSEQVFKRNS